MRSGNPTSLTWMLLLAIGAGALLAVGALTWLDIEHSTPVQAPQSRSLAGDTGLLAAETAHERLVRLLPNRPERWTRIASDFSEVTVERALLDPVVRGRHRGIYGDRPAGYRPTAIVLHSTGSGEPGSEFDSLEALGRFFRRNGVAASHYAVDRHGKIMQYVEDRDAAFHVATPGWNGISIGIELLNDSSGTQSFPPAQVNAARRLVVSLGETYGIPVEAVVRHRDVQPTDRTDPPANFGWDQFIDSLRDPRDERASGRLPQGTTRIAIS